MISTESNYHLGKWQKIYWNKGAQAASEYCERKRRRLDKTFNKITSMLPETDYSKTLSDYYLAKKERYNRDVFIDSINQEIWSRGRDEAGRTLFNYPSFRNRFDTVGELNQYLDKRIQVHKKLVETIQTVSEKMVDGTRVKNYFNELKRQHRDSLEKWQARKVAVSEASSWILPSRKNPLDAMHFSELHSEGHRGANASAIVLEKSADADHPALQGIFLQGDQLNGKEQHGTHICGIIAGKMNEREGHIGASPSAKIQLMNPFACSQIKDSPIDIVNFSGAIPNHFQSLISSFKENKMLFLGNLSSCVDFFPLQVSEQLMEIAFLPDQKEALSQLQQLSDQFEKMAFKDLDNALENKLLIQAIGNGGFNISANPDHLNRFSSLLKSKTPKILVVNLHPDGTTPFASSNFPGAPFADMTICAIGTDVLSTLPDGKYGRLSGTSMAAPFVTAAALLLKGAFPKLNIDEIRNCILDSATPIVLDSNAKPHLIQNSQELKNYTEAQIETSRQFFGRGLLNVQEAFKYARERMLKKEELC
jgi:hypothetical protein